MPQRKQVCLENIPGRGAQAKVKSCEKPRELHQLLTVPQPAVRGPCIGAQYCLLKIPVFSRSATLEKERGMLIPAPAVFLF